MAALQSQQNSFLKSMVIQVLSLFINTVISEGVGKKLFGGKVEVVSSDMDGTVVDVSLGSKTKYRVTIEKI